MSQKSEGWWKKAGRDFFFVTMERGTNQASKPLRRQNRLRLCEQWEFEGKGTRTTQWFCVILILIEISWLSWSGFFHPFRLLIAHFEGSHPKSEIWAPIFFPNNGMDQAFEIPQWRQVSSMYAKSRLGPQARFGACPGWCSFHPEFSSLPLSRCSGLRYFYCSIGKDTQAESPSWADFIFVFCWSR